MPQGQLLGDDTTGGLTNHMGCWNRERPQQRCGVLGQGGDREGLGRHRSAAHPAVVEGGEPVAIRRSVQLKLSPLSAGTTSSPPASRAVTTDRGHRAEAWGWRSHPGGEQGAQ